MKQSPRISDGARCHIHAGVRGLCAFLRVYTIQLEREMNTLALMNANSQCGGKMTTRSQQEADNPTGTMLEEYLLELNPSDAHINLRCNSFALAKEYCERLFPRSYIKDNGDGTATVQFAKDETDRNEALGIIQRIHVPNKWVMNRRLQDAGKRAERAA
jgi:hypothetical protein